MSCRLNKSGFDVSSEKYVAAKLKEKNPQFLWKNISDKFGDGTPDRCILFKCGLYDVWWLELKYLRQMPLRGCKVGLKPKQAAWLSEWKEAGGNCAVIVGFGKEKKVCVIEKDFRKLCHEGIKVDEIELIDYSSVYQKIKEMNCAKKS